MEMVAIEVTHDGVDFSVNEHLVNERRRLLPCPSIRMQPLRHYYCLKRTHLLKINNLIKYY
jgi:hypothetical protein